ARADRGALPVRRAVSGGRPRHAARRGADRAQPAARADPAELRGVGPLHPLTVGGTLGPVRFAATGDQAVFTIKRIDHLVLRVADLQAMLRFYRDVLGCPLEMVQQ